MYLWWTGQDSPLGAFMKRIYLRCLMFFFFKMLSGDNRSEVRNSAIQTLFSAIVVYGSYMKTETWLYCVDVIDSLLKEVFSSSSSSKPSIRASKTSLGRDRTVRNLSV